MNTELRIAVADDEPDMRKYFQRILPRLGHKVVAVAENGRALVDLCFQHQPDLVITDIFMPVLPGLYARWDRVVGKRVPGFLRLGTWIGGDRDGHPHVNDVTLRQALRFQSRHIFDFYLREVHRLGAELTICSTLSAVSEDLQELAGRRLDTIHIVGGGCQNTLLCQLTADACDRVVIAGPVEATAIGNVMVQALGLGLVGSLAQGREVIRRSFEMRTYEPQHPDRWQAPYQRFLKLIG